MNDALASRQADVPVLMRGATMLATDGAQVVLMHPKLAPLDTLISIGAAFEKTHRRAFFFAYVPATSFPGLVWFFGMGVPAAMMLYGVGIVGSVAVALAPSRSGAAALNGPGDMARAETRPPLVQPVALHQPPPRARLVATRRGARVIRRSLTIGRRRA
ncbi:MAG: hypothetical protein AAF318_01915 [Pseudomonadota bacterium]